MSRRRWMPPILWAAVILTLTSLPASDFAPAGAFAFPGADKLVHFGLYAVLGILLARAVGPSASGRTLGGVLVGVALFAAADEWHQRFVPGRAADPRDFAADLAGAAAGFATATCLLRRRIAQS
ncbi:MAG TPA: VanZ family protein [Gemmatimonadaceae bacterium]|nr:VanZ family protein [Gemmatimonadaceae bacterium]